MTENETKQEEKKEEKPEVSTKDKRYDFLKEARDLRDSIQRGVEDYKKLVERNEELTAKNILSGKSDAGEQPEVKKEESAADYAKRVMEGKI